MSVPVPSLGWSSYGLSLFQAMTASSSSRFTASLKLMTPAKKGASFLRLPGRGPGRSLIGWISAPPTPSLTTEERVAVIGRVWTFLCLECGTDGEGWYPEEVLERLKEKKEGRKEGKYVWLLQITKSLIIR